MRNVDSRLLMEKLDDVRHCMTSHSPNETVHVDASALSMNVDTGRVSVMHTQTFTPQMGRQVTVDHMGEEQWSEQLLETDERLDAIVAHLAQHSRPHHTHHKVPVVRGDVDTSVILDPPLRTLFNGQTLESQSESIVVQVPALPPLPPLQDMKRCPETDWFNKTKENEDSILTDQSLELPPQSKHSKKSLPHKKRISKKLKRVAGNPTPQQQAVAQDIVVISCGSQAQEEILPDSYAHDPPHHHIAHEVRPLLICQLCGEFYAEDQLKFYHHLKQHYEPPSTIIIENDLSMDKVANTCIVDNVAALPDSIVELSLESTVPKTMYQPADKHILYTTSDKSFYPCKLQYSMASIDKEPGQAPEPAKAELYDSLDKEMFTCAKCYKTFRKQKHCEDHIKQAHSNVKLDDMGEFSEPEDLMEGIHVTVEEGEHYGHMLPHLTVENGHVHQGGDKWYARACGAGCGGCGACAPAPVHHHHLKEEVLQRIFETEVPTEEPSYTNGSIIEETPELPPEPAPAPPPEAPDKPADNPGDKKKTKQLTCGSCPRTFWHRNSLLYHALSHAGRAHVCRDCGKGFYTPAALKIHRRMHNGDRPYKCEECGRDFRQWSDLKYHRTSLHSTQKHYKCEFCGKEFARKYSLNVHRRIHTGEKNYQCHYCTKTFRASSYRLSHMRTHTGQRPYKCTQCEKCFRVSGDLQRHILVHDKVKNRLEENKKKEDKPKRNQKKDAKPEPAEQAADTPKQKKVAVASTARPPVAKTTDKKQKKKPAKKDGAPNVTVTNKEFKINEYSNEVFDTRPDYKFKEVFEDYNKDIVSYKGKEYENDALYKDQRVIDKELAILKPMFRAPVINDERQYEYRAENTDGKMQIFTHIEKKDYNGPIITNVTLNDIRNVERDRDIHGESIENGFLDKLTAFYNIPAV